MDPDEGGQKSKRNALKFSHLYHKYSNYCTYNFSFNLFLGEHALIQLEVKYCTPVLSRARSKRYFLWAKPSWLMTIADCPLLGQSASCLNFYDESGRSTLAD